MTTRTSAIAAAAFTFLSCAIVQAQTGVSVKKLPVSADLGICAHKDEQTFNTGAQGQVRIKGIEHYYLFDFDANSLSGQEIVKASVNIKVSRGTFRRAGICTVPRPWIEGAGSGKPQNGATCFTHIKYPDVPWTAWGGTMNDATFNSPFMLRRTAEVVPQSDGWVKIELDPRLVQAVAAGLSHGLAVCDERGQARENIDVFTRKQAKAQPYLDVECRPAPNAAPAERPAPVARPDPGAADFTTGALRVDVTLAGQSPLGSMVEWQCADRSGREITLGDPEITLAHLPPNADCTLTVTTWLDNNHRMRAKFLARSSPALSVPTVPQISPPDTDPQENLLVQRHSPCALVSPTAQPADKPMPWRTIFTPRNAWASLQIVVFPDVGQDTRNITVHMERLADSRDDANGWPVQMYRAWYVPRQGQWVADPLVPLKLNPRYNRDLNTHSLVSETFAVPYKENKVPGQTCQAVFIDIWIPPTARPGEHAAQLRVMQGDTVLQAEAVFLQVSSATLGDELRIVGDMNTYDSPAYSTGAKDSEPEAFMEAERKFYRLAHSHRMTLNVLPYSQSGHINWRGAPTIEGKGKACRVTSWKEWDERFGPLLSGKAFSAGSGYVGPGASRPIRHMYLPLHENWPSPLAQNFTPWPPPKDYQQFLPWLAELPPVETCLSGDFKEAWKSLVRQFEQHVKQNQWTATRYQAFLNDKYFFRDPRQGGRGVSLWLLDEPMFADDFLALAEMARLTRQAYATPEEFAARSVEFRLDISRPACQRNYLDYLVDLNVCAGQLHSQRYLMRYRRNRLDETYWNYTMPPSFGADNLGWATWPVMSYCWGATGTLPWQTIGNDGSFTQAQETALMYPGTKRGLDGPIASIRLKAWRDGLQDAELLRMLATKMNWTPLQLRYFVGKITGLDGAEDGFDPKPDAGIVTFKGVNPAKLMLLRQATLLMLEQP